MSYVSVVRKNDGLVEETIWLQIGEGVVQGKEEKLRRCLVGKFGEEPFSLVVGSTSYFIQLWWEVSLKFSMVVPRRCSNGPPESKIRGDDGGGSRASTSEDVSNFEENSVRFGERLDCCVQKVVANGEEFGSDGRRSPISKRACLEDIMDSDEGVNGLVVGERGGLGLVQLCVPSFLREEGSVGLVSPLGLLIVGDRAVMIVPMEWIKSHSAWISGIDKAFQAKTTKTTKGVQCRNCGLRTEMVEAKVSIHPLNMVLANRSVVAAYFKEERALVVVGETSPDEKNSLRQLEFGAESDREWNSSCLA
ncbi:hypothetical protein AAG906_026291 [Vitis piasezkii]